MKKFLLIRNGAIIDLTKSTPGEYVIKGETLFRIYRTNNPSHYEDERHEIGFIVESSDNLKDLEHMKLETKIIDKYDDTSSNMYNKCSYYNDCSICPYKTKKCSCEFNLFTRLYSKLDLKSFSNKELEIFQQNFCKKPLETLKKQFEN